MLALMNRLLDWFRSLFWKEEMELTLVGLQYSGKTTFVNVIAVSTKQAQSVWAPGYYLKMIHAILCHYICTQNYFIY